MGIDFSIKAEEMQRIISILSVSAKLNAVDLTGRILITATKSKITFLNNSAATAVEVSSDTSTINEVGECAILFSNLRSFVNSFYPWDGKTGVKLFKLAMSGEQLILKVTNYFADNKKSYGRLKLQTFDTYTIAHPKVFENATFVLSSSLIKTAVNTVIYAINPNEFRINIQGLNIQFDDKYISFAGTNGYMLSQYKIENRGILKSGNFTISYNYIMGLKRLIGDNDQVLFELDDKEIRAKIGNVGYWGRLIVGHPYPDYNKEFEKYTDSIVISKEMFLSSLRPFIDTLNSDDNNRLRLSIAKGNLVLQNEIAKFNYGADLDYTGDFAIDVNGKFLLNTIDAISDEEVGLSFSNQSGSLIFYSNVHKDHKALITPIQYRG